MAYQNVGTPRFFISWGDWWKSMGQSVDSPGLLNPITTTFANMSSTQGNAWTFGDLSQNAYAPSPNAENGINFAFWLNHNGARFKPFIKIYNDAAQAAGQSYQYQFPSHIGANNIENTVNFNPDWSPISYNGWSMAQWKSTSAFNGSWTSGNTIIQCGWYQPTDTQSGFLTHTIVQGCCVFGRVYDMPHSPELKLTMAREMDGVKRVRTKGGNDLVHRKYLKSPMWGDLAPWELRHSENPIKNQELARVGRRSWDLSFNYMTGSDMFGSNEILGNAHTSPNSTIVNFYYPGGLTGGTTEGYESGDATSSGLDYNLLTDDNFFSQVLHKTNGGALPFIFQPDSNNSNPDQFAICKLDMKSYQFKQVANGMYNIKIKIREIW